MPWSKVLSFNDPFQYQSSIRAADVELYPTTRGEFRAELTQINLHQLWMQRFDEKLPQVYAARVRPGRRVIGFLTTDQPGMQHCGVEVSPRDIVVSNHEVMHHRTRGDCRYGAMSLTNDDFDTACEAILGHECSGLSRKHLIRPDSALMFRLVRLHEMAGQIAKSTPEISCAAGGGPFAGAGAGPCDDKMPRRRRGAGHDGRRPAPRRDRRAVRGIPGSTSRYAAVPDGDLRRHRGVGANASLRLRGASRHGPDPLSVLAQDAPGPARVAGARMPRRQPSPDWRPITASGNWAASRWRIENCSASSLRKRCGGPRTTPGSSSIVPHRLRVRSCTAARTPAWVRWAARERRSIRAPGLLSKPNGSMHKFFPASEVA